MLPVEQSKVFSLLPTKKLKALPTLAKQKAVRGMTPYWANAAIATPLGFTM